MNGLSNKETTRNPVGENIRKIRKKQGLTQADLAEAVGVKSATISRYETGEIQLSMEMAIEIANALKCSVADFYPSGNAGSDFGAIAQENYNALKNSNPIPKQDRLLAAFDRLNEIGQEIAISRVEELGLIPGYQKQLSDASEEESLSSGNVDL